MMPIVYRCKRCGFIIHIDARSEDGTWRTSGIAYADDIVKHIVECPRCGAKLTLPSLRDVTITIEDVAERTKRAVEEYHRQILGVGLNAKGKHSSTRTAARQSERQK